MSSPEFDHWFFQWQCDREGTQMPVRSICQEAFAAGWNAGLDAQTVADEPETWRPDCPFRVGISHRCASHLGHQTPHQMVQTDHARARGGTLASTAESINSLDRDIYKTYTPPETWRLNPR